MRADLKVGPYDSQTRGRPQRVAPAFKREPACYGALCAASPPHIAQPSAQ